MIYNQSVFDPWPIESESIQAVITSPPYFALRKYSIPDVIIGGDKDCKHEFALQDMELGHENRQGKGSNTLNQSAESHVAVHGKKVGKQGFCIHCNAWKGQYGLEPTPSDYVAHSLLWAKEAWRVLKNDGVMFLNLADSYSGGGRGYNGKSEYLKEVGVQNPKLENYPNKCQLLIPHRVVIALVDAGWTLRNTIIWHKSNAMPESVTDRFSKKYEYIFMFTKQEKYYFDLNAVREPHKEVSIERLKRAVGNNNKWVNGADGQTPHGLSQPRPNINKPGANTGENNKEPYRQNNPHLLRIKEKEYKERIGGDYLVGNLNPKGKNPGDAWNIPTQPASEKHYAMWPERLVERMVKCSTKAGDIVLDPFCGSGTTLKVAEQLNRKGIGIDLGYHEISKRRTGKIQKELFI